jgi:geranylgeranyl diphosphate synthase type II
MLAAEAIDPSKVELALNPACALEMVHAFSLIHDDLPALDNDDLRRGRPTCHVQFGEATAILAGDALFALAFEAMSETPAAPHLIAQGIRILAQSAGSAGLVGGEIVDLESEGLEPTEDRLEFIHTRKTGALIRASCVLGALFAGGDDRALAELEAFGNEVGLAFQIADDILNETSTPEMLGKAAGSDRERQKATYPALYGLEASKAQARYLAERAVNRLGYLGPSAEHLAEVARFAVERLN